LRLQVMIGLEFDGSCIQPIGLPVTEG
jgi:hypothetical protein